MSDQVTSVPQHSGLTDSTFGHLTALAVLLGPLVGWLPSIATFLAIVWYCGALWDMPLARRLRARWRWKRRGANYGGGPIEGPPVDD